MNNPRFNFLIGQPTDGQGNRLWTLERIAAAIYSGHAHVSQVINNKPGRGGNTRKKLVKFFKANFTYWPDILDALGWTESGALIPHGTFHSGTNLSAGKSHTGTNQPP